MAAFLLLSLGADWGDWTSGGVGEVWVCLQLSCCTGGYSPLFSRVVPCDWGLGFSRGWFMGYTEDVGRSEGSLVVRCSAGTEIEALGLEKHTEEKVCA